MWVFFEQKCVKRLPFSILHKFTQSDVIALSSLFKQRFGCGGEDQNRCTKVFYFILF